MTDEMWHPVGLLLRANSNSITLAACTLLGSAERQIMHIPCPKEPAPKRTQSKRASGVRAFSGNGFQLYWQNITAHAVRWLNVILQWLDTSSRAAWWSAAPALGGCVIAFVVTCPCYSPACGPNKSNISLVGSVRTKGEAKSQLEMGGVGVCAYSFMRNFCLSAQMVLFI